MIESRRCTVLSLCCVVGDVQSQQYFACCRKSKVRFHIAAFQQPTCSPARETEQTFPNREVEEGKGHGDVSSPAPLPERVGGSPVDTELKQPRVPRGKWWETKRSICRIRPCRGPTEFQCCFHKRSLILRLLERRFPEGKTRV